MFDKLSFYGHVVSQKLHFMNILEVSLHPVHTTDQVPVRSYRVLNQRKMTPPSFLFFWCGGNAAMRV